MLRAMELGKNGLGSTAPNPMVGCCIVCDDTIIGEGYTSPYGGPHAEVNAINSVTDKNLLSRATLYVTLEPCSHHGKTPPCANLIAKYKIPEVVIGLKDPHVKVAGKGIEKLNVNGVNVTLGVLERECREHHKRFLTYQEKKRPYIILKWAESSDGFIAPAQGKRNSVPEPFWITNTYSKKLVHQWRSEEMGILVGTQTAIDDNPKLNVRNWTGKNPVRVVLDRSLRIPHNFHLMDGSSKTIVITDLKKTSTSKNLLFETIDFNKQTVEQICRVLHRHQITSILVEGGTRTLQTFIDSKFWDEARIFKGNGIFGSGIAAPVISGKLISKSSISGDTLTILQHD